MSAPSLAVVLVRALMDRHGLPKHRQSAWLSEATGLSYSQAHRRMNGASPWTLEDLQQVASLLGESLSDLVASTSSGHDSVPGVIRVGDTELACRMWLGAVVDKPRASTIVALKTSRGWAAIEAAHAEGAPAYAIERLESRPSAAPAKRIAVLDDDQDLADSICDSLIHTGFAAVAFYRVSDLLSSSKIERFDGYILDWIVGDASVRKAISELRNQDDRCPIIVLTAQVSAGVVSETDVADAVRAFDLHFAEKPVRAPILAATLSRAFASS